MVIEPRQGGPRTCPGTARRELWAGAAGWSCGGNVPDFGLRRWRKSRGGGAAASNVMLTKHTGICREDRHATQPVTLGAHRGDGAGNAWGGTRATD